MINEAFFVLAEGDASTTEIDEGMTLRLQSPDGPASAGRLDWVRCAAGNQAQTGATAATLADSVRGIPLRRTQWRRELDSNSQSLREGKAVGSHSRQALPFRT